MNDPLMRVQQLTAKLIDDELSSADAEELEELLRGDRRAQISLLNDLHVHANLFRIVAPSSATGVQDELLGVTRDAPYAARDRATLAIGQRAKFWVACAMGLTVLVIGGWALVTFRGLPSAGRRPIERSGAQVEGFVGTLEIVRDDVSMQARPGDKLCYGDQLKSAGSSTAHLVLDDGSVLKLSESSLLSLPSDPVSTEFHLHRGSLWAEMAEQHRPVRFKTSHACTSVAGTVLQLTTTAASTRVDVCEGEVLVKGISDPARNLPVRAGQYVSAGRVLPESASRIPAPPDTFQIDLAQQQPVGWLGAWDASHGLQAVPRRFEHVSRGETTFFEIGSGCRAAGFFTLHEDSVLQYTARFQERGFMHVFLGTYSPIGEGHYLNVEIKHDAMWPKPNEWKTYRVRLSEALYVGNKLRTGSEYPGGRHVVWLLFSTQDLNLGMEISDVTIRREASASSLLNPKSAAPILGTPQ